jgi:tetratricopeptide (TPR) repeat protein
MELFKRGRVAESVADFDRVIALAPAREPYLWQRGLSLYYAERLEDAAAQFEVDVAVNPNDTEESIWRWLAQARAHRLAGQTPAAAAAAARADLLAVGRDPRPVMRAAMELFAGEGGAAALDAAGGARGDGASSSSSSGESTRPSRAGTRRGLRTEPWLGLGLWCQRAHHSCPFILRLLAIRLSYPESTP